MKNVNACHFSKKICSVGCYLHVDILSKSFVVSEKFGKKIAYCLVLSAFLVSGILGSRTALKAADCLYIVVTNTSLQQIDVNRHTAQILCDPHLCSS